MYSTYSLLTLAVFSRRVAVLPYQRSRYKNISSAILASARFLPTPSHRRR